MLPFLLFSFFFDLSDSESKEACNSLELMLSTKEPNIFEQDIRYNTKCFWCIVLFIELIILLDK